MFDIQCVFIKWYNNDINDVLWLFYDDGFCNFFDVYLF